MSLEVIILSKNRVQDEMNNLRTKVSILSEDLLNKTQSQAICHAKIQSLEKELHNSLIIHQSQMDMKILPLTQQRDKI